MSEGHPGPASRSARARLRHVSANRARSRTALVAAVGVCVSLLVAEPSLGPADAAGAPASGVAAAAVPTSMVATPVPTAEAVRTSARGRDRLAIGDSLMVGAAARMGRRGFAVHARVGRQFSSAPAIIRSYGARLPRNVVIELGTNGTITLSHCRAVVRAAGRGRKVFLVTNRVPRSWERANNRTLRRCDRGFRSGRVHLVDWHRASAGHPEWLARDGFHPIGYGQRRFVRLIDQAVDRKGR
jgi:hypothetical protein